MALINRQTLKNYFQKGGFATEKHFVDLIDSSLNKVDDGISMNSEYGFKLNPHGYSSRLISFFKKATQKEPDFSINTVSYLSQFLSLVDLGKILLSRCLPLPPSKLVRLAKYRECQPADVVARHRYRAAVLYCYCY